MAKIVRVELKPSDTPNVQRVNSYELFTYPVMLIRIHICFGVEQDCTDMNHILADTRGNLFSGAIRCAWDKRQSPIDTIVITYPVEGGASDPHAIARQALKTVERTLQQWRSDRT